MKKADLINAIGETYKDEKVKRDPEISGFLLKFAQQLDEGQELGLVSVKLSKAITNYSLKNNFIIPKSLSTLYAKVEKDAEKYRGMMSTNIWL
ncbi:bacteriocin immunity protein [Pediococcus stilesii]|uniref:Bacteriocin immunity protein n=1 Tax=Pediococcus stilesii TaxID=331679 RepID=A0A0R2KXQ5_9LACO|nr:bacteriocin immunity protein [Pediococcus stilesii]KRN94158.1 hypothetical protein IV81_GL001572 [Pediococcus stilesii]TLQ04440.1 bacteriocin immunity protein [Pediococcus stilesii]